MPALAFAVQSNRGQYHHDGPLRLVNGYVETRGAEGKGGPIHYAIPGLAPWLTLPTPGAGQALLSVDGALIIVAGRSVYSTTPAGQVKYLGGFLGDGLVTLARNRRLPSPEIIVCGGGLVSIIQNGALTPLNDASLPGVVSACVVNGYAFYALPGGQVVASDIDDATLIDPLSVAYASASPDGLVRAYGWGETLVLFGASSTEFWSDVGGLPFPFAPIAGTASKLGLLAAASVAEVPVREGDVALMWVASDATVRKAQGYAGAAVSIAAVETAIAKTTDKSRISATVHSIPGHSFYVLSGPDWSWAYDASTGLWHERVSYGMGRWRAAACERHGDATVAMDALTGALYTLGGAVDGTNPVVWSVRALLQSYPTPLRCNRVFLDMIPGQGLNSADPHNADPKVMLRWSHDNGVTWGPTRALAAGGIGESKRRVVTRQLGTSDEDGWVFEVSMSAGVVRGLTGAFADAQAVAR